MAKLFEILTNRGVKVIIPVERLVVIEAQDEVKLVFDTGYTVTMKTGPVAQDYAALLDYISTGLTSSGSESISISPNDYGLTEISV